MDGTISDMHILRDKLIPQFIKSNGALNVPLLKTNTGLYNELLEFQLTLGVPTIGIAFQHISQNINAIPLCQCGKNVKWKSSTSSYNEYCSTKCSANSVSKKEKITATCTERYGVSNPSKIPSVRTTAQDTMELLYGVRHAVHSTEFRDKTTATNLSRYGHSSPMASDDVREKVKATMLNRYGVVNPSQNTQIRKKTSATCVEKYGGNAPSSSLEIREQIKKTITGRYGVENIGQISLAPGVLEKLQSPDWLIAANDTKSISAIAKDLGITVRTVSQYFTKHSIVYKKHSASMFESAVMEFIKDRISAAVICNSRDIISPAELDLYIPDLNLAFECNGSYWHSELNGKNSQYHLLKSEKCLALGITLVHIWEHEWEASTELIKSRISSLLGANSKIYGRKCVIKEVSNSDSVQFLEANHIQGACVSKVNLGLYSLDRLVGLMTFGKSRFGNTSDFELLRYCSLQGLNITGGASKLLSYFRKMHTGSIVSYSDRARNTGNMYKMLGFKMVSDTQPAYHYTKDYINFENRMKFQKHKLEKLLPVFDPTKTEWENMQMNGYDRVWDCGTRKFLLE